MAKIERKYLAHFIDAGFGKEVNYIRLGRDLEDFNIELNPDVEVVKNILGEQSVRHSGYEVQAEVEPYYAEDGDPLFEQLATIANERDSGGVCKTTMVDVLLKADGSCVWAYREDVYVTPNSIGGDTTGVQIPFTVNYEGNRVKGTFDLTTKTFTPEGDAAAQEPAAQNPEEGE